MEICVLKQASEVTLEQVVSQVTHSEKGPLELWLDGGHQTVLWGKGQRLRVFLFPEKFVFGFEDDFANELSRQE